MYQSAVDLDHPGSENSGRRELAIMEIEQIDFSIACWYQTGLMRLMLRDLSYLISPANSPLRLDHMLIIRKAEYPMRRFLKVEWESFSPQLESLAKRNRSRLVVFDKAIADAISRKSDASLLPSLQAILAVWHERMCMDDPQLSEECRDRCDITQLVAFFRHLPGSLSDSELDREFQLTVSSSDPLSIFLQTWLFAFESPQLWKDRTQKTSTILAALPNYDCYQRALRKGANQFLDEIRDLVSEY